MFELPLAVIMVVAVPVLLLLLLPVIFQNLETKQTSKKINNKQKLSLFASFEEFQKNSTLLISPKKTLRKPTTIRPRITIAAVINNNDRNKLPN